MQHRDGETSVLTFLALAEQCNPGAEFSMRSRCKSVVDLRWSVDGAQVYSAQVAKVKLGSFKLFQGVLRRARGAMLKT